MLLAESEKDQISPGVPMPLVSSVSRLISRRTGICGDDVTEIACQITTFCTLLHHSAFSWNKSYPECIKPRHM